ncbi:hypothetical protein SASPL_148447 [Salvia splendens]|uniref:Pectinesterase inhibitor domain-containing protein n=1 Tax=Salvia splendens TaxID=180675 RepID=A0A8X8WAU2_SALSN|nr:hypothetical protein SASPL_148447 [Salvia splendens]
MKSRLCCLASIIVIFLSIPGRASSADLGTQTRIEHVCSETSDYKLCQAVLGKNLYTSIADFDALTQICLSNILMYISDTLTFIKDAERNETNTRQREILADCDEGYGSMLTQFENAAFKFAKGDYKSMLSEIVDIKRYVTQCETALGNKLSELQKRNVDAKVFIEMFNASGKLIGHQF